MSGHEGKERRKAPRADVCTTAMVLVRHNDGVALTIESISTDGARLVGPMAVGIAERVQILFEIDGRPVEVIGEVVRVDARDMASDRVSVKFVDVDIETRGLIGQLVRRMLEHDER